MLVPTLSAANLTMAFLRYGRSAESPAAAKQRGTQPSHSQLARGSAGLQW
jgi:hypothetical protein